MTRNQQLDNMFKRIIYTTAILLLALDNKAQITTFISAEPHANEKKVAYDSTMNYVGMQAELLIGQELFVIPKPGNRQENGYFGFYKQYEYTDYRPAQTCDYHLFANKTFLVEEVLPSLGTGKYDKTKLVLKLKETESDSVYYYLYDGNNRSLDPFFIKGFYIKEKKRCPGKQIVLKNRNPWENVYNEKKVPLHDVMTGRPIDIDPQAVWTIKDIIIDAKHEELSYLITNAKGQTLTVGVNAINDYKRKTGPCALAYDEELKKIHLSKPDMYKYIMEGKICTGMTTHMVRLAWGDPEKVHRASFGESWVYSSGERLFFEKGILTSFH